MPARRYVPAVLAALAIAACTDSQSPDGAPLQSAPGTVHGLPVLSSARVVAGAKPAGGQYEITLRFINPPTATQQQRFTDAKTKWEHVISGDVPDVTGLIPARTCGSSFKTPLFNGTIDDILIATA